MDKLAELVARSDIHDALLRYARGVDRKDWDAVRATYHVDAHDEHGTFSGTVDEFIEWVDARHKTIPFSSHFLSNSLIEFKDEDTAFVETYFIAMRRMPKGSANGAQGTAEIDAEVIGRYLDRFERRDGQWKVARRRVVYDSSRSVASSHVPPADKRLLGARNKDDLVFTWFARS